MALSISKVFKSAKYCYLLIKRVRCATESLHTILQEDGGIKALLGMVRCGSSDVIAQIARGLANFAKCETRGVIQG